jgi:hypothetical protein
MVNLKDIGWGFILLILLGIVIVVVWVIYKEVELLMKSRFEPYTPYNTVVQPGIPPMPRLLKVRTPFITRPHMAGTLPNVGEFAVVGSATAFDNYYRLLARVIDQLDNIYAYQVQDTAGRSFPVYNNNPLFTGDIVETGTPEGRLTVKIDSWFK